MNSRGLCVFTFGRKKDSTPSVDPTRSPNVERWLSLSHLFKQANSGKSS